MFSMKFKKPGGVRDFLPESARIKRDIENKIYRIFSTWGYQEVLTPSFEYLETFLMGNSFEFGEKIFKFFDRRGRVLALRPDMTTPIARLVSNHYENVEYPLRLCYFSNVFRFEDHRGGRQNEMFQAGAELIGWNEIDADAEIIALAIKSLQEAGIKDFKVNIGHTGFWEGILKSERTSEKEKDALKSSLLNKDFVTLKEIIKNLSMNKHNKALLLDITKLHGGIDVLNEAEKVSENEISKKAIRELKRLAEILAYYGAEEYITFDLGLMRDLDYYTGMIFEGYTPGLGHPVCGGGRYDNLIEKFNGVKPATGFMINIDGVLKVLERIQCKNEASKDILIVYNENSVGEGVEKALDYRNRGYTTDIISEKQMGKLSDEIKNIYKKIIRV